MQNSDVINAVYERLQLARRHDKVATAIELGDEEYEAVGRPQTMYGLPVRHIPGETVRVVSGPRPDVEDFAPE